MAGSNIDFKDMAARAATGAVAGAIATIAFTSTVRKLQPKGVTLASPGTATLAGAAAFGALLAVASPHMGRATGAVAGGGLWLASEMGWLPAFTIRPARGKAPRGATMLAGHLAWGWSVAEIVEDAQAVRAAWFGSAEA